MMEDEGKKVQDWTAEELQQYLKEKGFEEESALFNAEEISGKNLSALEKSDLKEIGIKTLGRRIELMDVISQLIGSSSEPEPTTATCNPSQPCSDHETVWNKKITKDLKETWSAALKNNYKTKTAIIIREASKLWHGNSKIYFKQNQENKLKLEELVTSLTVTCTIKEIGFGREAIRSHVIQWSQEKNRRLSDGYDYELKHTPAKRARLSTGNSSADSPESCTEIDTDHEHDEGESLEIKDITRKSSQVVFFCYFDVNSMQALGVKQHLLPLGKKIGVKCRSLGKYDMLSHLAKQLISESYVSIAIGSNFRNLKREDVTVNSGSTIIANSPESSPSTCSGGDTEILNSSNDEN